VNPRKYLKLYARFSVGAKQLVPAFFRDASPWKNLFPIYENLFAHTKLKTIRTSFVIFAVCLAIAACEPEATPYPVDVPTEVTEVPEVPAGTPIRYALAPNTTGSVADIQLLTNLVSVEQPAEMPGSSEIGNHYDLIAAYGSWSGAALSPITQHVSLLINPALPPLDDSAIINVIRRAINPSAATNDIPGVEIAPLESAPSASLKAELANAGWPDGFDVIIAHDAIPGMAQIVEQLQTIGIHGQLTLLVEGENTRYHLALVMWTTPEERAQWGQDSNLIDLYALPISYWASPDLTITFTPAGWPLPNRE
jgi:hypothetical protein